MTADLIGRLEAASEGSRDLSDEVLVACGWRYDQDFGGSWFSPSSEEYVSGRQPDPTRSLDDAMALVQEGTVDHLGQKYQPCRMGWNVRILTCGGALIAVGATPALALSAAIVKAREVR